VSRASVWTALSVVYGFVQAKALKLGVPPTIVYPAPCYGRHCFYMRLGTVNSSSSVTVGGSLSLIAQALEHFRYFVLFPQDSEPSWRIGLLYCDFDPSGSHHLPIAAGK